MVGLLFIINTLGGGGAEKVLVDLVSKLPKDKYNITIITVTDGYLSHQLPSNVKLKILVKNRISFFKRIKSYLLCNVMPSKFFARRFFRGNYDVKIAYLQGFPTHVLAADQDTSCKKVAFIHSDFSKFNNLNKLYDSKEECLKEYHLFDQVCFVANSAKEGFINSIGQLDNTSVIHNVIDIDAVRQLAKKECSSSFKTKGLKIISLGRLVPVKGYERIILIAASLMKKNIDFEIWILGTGPLFSKLKAMIHRLGLENMIYLKGYHENPYPYLSQADLYVCSSFYEGYNTAIVEALSLGVPVLTTQCSGMDEILCNGLFGGIVNNDQESLESEIFKIATNPQVLDQYRSQAALGKAFHSSHSSVAEYESLFENLLDNQ